MYWAVSGSARGSAARSAVIAVLLLEAVMTSEVWIRQSESVQMSTPHPS